MPSWTTLNKDAIENWKDKVNKATSEEKPQRVGDYYQYLMDNKHIYGNLAYQAAQNTGFPGRLANNYLDHIAQKEKVEMTDALRQTLMVKLALSDMDARLQNEGNAIGPKIIRDYHHEVLGEAGLSPRAWTGTLLETIGEGVFMLGEGPVDQNGGQFTVNNIKHFITQAAETGHPIHKDTAHFMGTLLSDHLVCQTLSEVPFMDSFHFIKGVTTGLEGNKIEILTHSDTYKLGAQLWIRRCYNQLFGALEAETHKVPKSVKPTPQEIQTTLAQMMVDPMAGDKQLYHEMANQPSTLLGMTKLYTKLLGTLFKGIDPIQEAQVEHERVYGTPIKQAWSDFITTDEPISLSTKATNPLPAEILESKTDQSSLNNASASTSSGFWNSWLSWLSNEKTSTEQVPPRDEVPVNPLADRLRHFSFFNESAAVPSASSFINTRRQDHTPMASHTSMDTANQSTWITFLSNMSPAALAQNTSTVSTNDSASGGYNNTMPGTDIPVWGPNRYSTWADFMP